jgi:hypothetical protein
MNKLVDNIERNCFDKIAILAWEHISTDHVLKLDMINSYLQHGKLTDRIIERIKNKFK